LTEPALIQDVTQVAAFESVYRAHFAAIWRTVRHLGIPEKDAIDAAQEVFLVAYRKWNEFEGRSSVKTWLYGIAFRVACGRRRRAPARREVLGDDAVALVEPRSDLTNELEQRDLLRVLESVLEALPIEQRVVFTLFEIEGLSGDEIAEALGTPAGTVRSRLRLARQTFANAVKRRRLHDRQAVTLGGVG
jgi:RNA polymerase sigma-70 factor (ECF subfamily)